MILSFRSRPVQRYWQSGETKGLNPQHVAKIRRILDSLDRALLIEDLNVPGYRLHKLSGFSPDRWSIVVSANWRITFSFNDGDAFDIDYEDYH